MPKITKRFIDNIGQVDKDTFFWDSELGGFGVRMAPTGRAVFIVQYRNAQGRTRRMKVGLHGRMTPDEARKEAKQYLASVDKGADPSEKRIQTRQGATVAELGERYMVEHAYAKKKATSATQDRFLLNAYVIPKLGMLKIESATRADVAKLHNSLSDKPVQANRVLSLMSKMFNLAENWGLRPNGTNPCMHIEKYKEKNRERYLSKEELARLGKALAITLKEQPENFAAFAAIRLLIFTGCRKSEILTLKWEYVDLDHGILRLPDSKTGAKLVPLAATALEVLRNMPRIQGNPYVCPGRKSGSHLIGLQKVWERVRAKADLEDVRLHDLRHSFASIGAASGMGLPIIGALLGHRKSSTTERYAHLAADPLKQAADKIANELAAAMDAPESESAKIIPFRKRSND